MNKKIILLALLGLCLQITGQEKQDVHGNEYAEFVTALFSHCVSRIDPVLGIASHIFIPYTFGGSEAVKNALCYELEKLTFRVIKAFQPQNGSSLALFGSIAFHYGVNKYRGKQSEAEYGTIQRLGSFIGSYGTLKLLGPISPSNYDFLLPLYRNAAAALLAQHKGDIETRNSYAAKAFLTPLLIKGISSGQQYLQCSNSKWNNELRRIISIHISRILIDRHKIHDQAIQYTIKWVVSENEDETEVPEGGFILIKNEKNHE